jgi:hypothetical protein
VLDAQLLDHRRQQHVGDRLERADVDASDGAGDEPLDGITGGIDAGDDVAGVPEDDLAERGQLHGAGSAGPVEQRAADEPLEDGDLLADGRLGVAESRCRLAERALGRHRVEGDQVLELEVAELHGRPQRGLHDHQRS